MTYVFSQLNFFEQFDLNQTVFTMFVDQIEQGYRDIPYHNNMHACSTLWPGRGRTITADLAFDEAEIRTAERRLVAALEDPDPTAWVFEYTGDAVFDAGGEHAVQGREALLQMANAMQPLSSVSFRPMRTEGSGDCATVWFAGSWLSGSAEDESRRVSVRGIIVWRKRCIVTNLRHSLFAEKKQLFRTHFC